MKKVFFLLVFALCLFPFYAEPRSASGFTAWEGTVLDDHPVSYGPFKAKGTVTATYENKSSGISHIEVECNLDVKSKGGKKWRIILWPRKTIFETYQYLGDSSASGVNDWIFSFLPGRLRNVYANVGLSYSEP